jgi:DNA adenine methylase
VNRRMEFFDTPPLRYTGSKWQIADWIIHYIPADHDSYVEPYCGGAAVFFRKYPSKIEVLNDLNGDVVNFFDVLRNRPDELLRAIELTPYARAEYERSYEPCDDPLERARRFYIRTRQVFRERVNKNPSWRSQRTHRNNRITVTEEWRRMDGLLNAVDRLRNAQLDCNDALNVIRRYDTLRTVFYVDPPYVMDSRKSLDFYAFEMSDDDHRALAAVLHNVKGMVLLSGYDSPLYRDLYADWYVSSKTTTTNGNGQAIEYLWISPQTREAFQLPLFSSEVQR